MAKRFTDTEKWKKQLIRGLPAAYKLLWFYICDDCNHAGIWEVDMQVAEIRIGESIDEKKALDFLKTKIVVLDAGRKWFIPSFIDFQYKSLKATDRATKSVVDILKKHGLINDDYEILRNSEGAYKGLVSPWEGCKDKDMDKDKDKDKDLKLKEDAPEIFVATGSMPGPDQIPIMKLPEVKAGSVIVMVRVTQKEDVGMKEVYDMWDAFKIQHFTGKKYYQDENAVHSHFINWAKTQKFNGNKAVTNGGKHSVGSSATGFNGKNGGFIIVAEKLRNELAVPYADGTESFGI